MVTKAVSEGLTSVLELLNHKESLLKEINYLKTKLADHDTGHIRTAIGVLEERVTEIESFMADFNAKVEKYIRG